ncbi:MAG: GatB/YqeY domain-containing protein [Armatimonadetes bacterium]|nr:GatB/YqeY domain-containing protein [Armatimonadota bacterium]
MSQKQKLQENLKSAMKARDELRVSTIRLALSAVRNSEIDRRRELTDEEVTEVLARESKRRREAIEGAEKARRPDVADRERSELEILSEYLPRQLSEEEIEAIAREVIAETGAAGPKDRGRVMGALMQRLRGRADGKMVGQVVERILQS